MTVSRFVYSLTGLATLWHVTVQQQQQQSAVAKPVGLEKNGKREGGEQGEEVADGEDEIQLPLPSTASTETRSHSPHSVAQTSFGGNFIYPEKCIFRNLS